MMISKEKEERLPIDSVELDLYISKIVRDFDLPDTDDTVEAICTQILHTDNRIGRVRRSHFADCAVKFLANKAAYQKVEAFRKADAEKAKAAKEKA